MVLYCVVFVCIIMRGVGTIVRCMYFINVCSIVEDASIAPRIQCNRCTIHVVYDTV